MKLCRKKGVTRDVDRVKADYLNDGQSMRAIAGTNGRARNRVCLHAVNEETSNMREKCKYLPALFKAAASRFARIHVSLPPFYLRAAHW